MSASHDCFASADYPGGVTLKTGDHKSAIDFILTPQGIITGFVLDPDNQPIAGVEVVASRRSYINGVNQFVDAAPGSVSDVKGRYLIAGLAPGLYFVSTRPPASLAQGNRARYVPTFFPGGTTLTSAVSLDIVPGSVFDGINLRPVKADLSAVRGKVVDQTGTDAAVIVTLLPRASSTIGVRRQMTLESANQEFLFANVLPGDYLLTAEIHQKDARVTNGQFGYKGRQLINVGEKPLDNLVLTINKGVDIPGVLRVEDGSLTDLTQMEVRMPVADLEGRTIGFPAKGPISREGHFVVKAASLDRHVANVVGIPRGFYIKSFTSGGIDLLANDLDLTPGIASPIEIVLTGKPAAVAGKVTDRNDKAAPQSTVALVPVKPAWRERSRFYRTATTDEDGRFSLGNVTPGEYEVYAFEKLEEGAILDALFRAPYESNATRIEVRESGFANTNLKLIPVR